MHLRLCVFSVESSAVLHIWRLQEYTSGLDQSSCVISDCLIGVGCGRRVLCMLPRVDYWSSFLLLTVWLVFFWFDNAVYLA